MLKEAYNKAINKAKQLLEDEHVTQEEVNKAVEELNVAISKLTGVKPKDAKVNLSKLMHLKNTQECKLEQW